MLTVAQRGREKTDGQRRALRPANSQAPSTKKKDQRWPCIEGTSDINEALAGQAVILMVKVFTVLFTIWARKASRIGEAQPRPIGEGRIIFLIPAPAMLERWTGVANHINSLSESTS
jgi:hypothetical protein